MFVLLTTACGGVINPPALPTRPAPPPPRPTAIPEPTATSEPTATPEPARWVKNHRITPMWSAPQRETGAISFGTTSSTFCSFRVVREADDARILVYNPHADGTFWIDADAVGPVVEPPHRAGPKPVGVNCTEAIYDGVIVMAPGATSSGTAQPDLTRTVTPAPVGTVTPTAAGTLTATPTGTLTPVSTAATTPVTSGTATSAPNGTSAPAPTGSATPVGTGTVTSTTTPQSTATPTQTATPVRVGRPSSGASDT